eukprot:GHRR01001756.1.p1 GENE.GHRR01001756.1~~GHRR01001756.1.p1  ORF type:complete len:330 (+),score=102.76 GHRR01001756.1:102-1091(+)
MMLLQRCLRPAGLRQNAQAKPVGPGKCTRAELGCLQRFCTIASCASAQPGTSRHEAWQQHVQRCCQAVSKQLPKVAAICTAAAVIGAFSPQTVHAASAAAAAGEGSSFLSTAISFMLHLDKHLSAMIQQHGTLTYGILWTIVFCETGLVLTPFLPGDSLLFAAGAFAGMGQLNISLLFAVFMTSAVLGDAVNYAIGNKLGRWALDRKVLEQKYIKQTEAFYDKYGGKTVVLARFVPIVRTFAPFVAGIGSMSYSRFAMYNVGGALLWTLLFLGAGYFFGNLPVVQHNFTLVVLGIVAVSVVPVVLEVLEARKEQQGPAGGGAAGRAAGA